MPPFPLVCTNQDVSDVSSPPWSPHSLEGQHTPASPSSPALLAAVPGLYPHSALHSFTCTLFQTVNPVTAVFCKKLAFIIFPLTLVIYKPHSCRTALLGSTLLATALVHNADMQKSGKPGTHLYFKAIVFCIVYQITSLYWLPLGKQKKSISQIIAMLTFLLYHCTLIFLQCKISISGSMFPQGTAMKLSYQESWFVSLKKVTENTSHRRLLLRNHLL